MVPILGDLEFVYPGYVCLPIYFADGIMIKTESFITDGDKIS